MPSEGNGRLTFLLRPQKNAKGPYHIGRSNFKGTIDLSNKVFFATRQPDGSLMIAIEEYDEDSTATQKKT